MIELTDETQLDEFYQGSYYTITGAGGDLSEWEDGYKELLEKDKIGTPKAFYSFTGDMVNHKYGLTGDNAFPIDLHFISFPLEGLDTGKLAMFKITMGDRWFDDIIDNSRERKYV